LKELAQEVRSENAVMRVLAEKTTRDAAAVKVLTVITLIYLPATVVAVRNRYNFYPTAPQSVLMNPAK
jgi:hypothetical protein